jgi:hypothetical protein
MSFKHGTVDRQKDGRHFTDMTEAMLGDELRRLAEFQCVETWKSVDVRPARSGEFWTSAIVRRGRASH